MRSTEYEFETVLNRDGQEIPVTVFVSDCEGGPEILVQSDFYNLPLRLEESRVLQLEWEKKMDRGDFDWRDQ